MLTYKMATNAIKEGNPMPFFSNRVYDNVRTRVIVVHDGKMLLLEPHEPEAGWQLPGGGMEPNESLTECGEREVFEETGLNAKVTSVAFLREFVVPKYCTALEPIPAGHDGVGYGIEVYLYGHLTAPENANGKNLPQPRLERPGAQMPHWIPVTEIPKMPVWPKELKSLAAALAQGYQPRGILTFVSELESPWAEAPHVAFP
jgi:ADP-ribose pyrophosphatase YjhB (NUDIX family)